jgi:hypothetical protein
MGDANNGRTSKGKGVLGGFLKRVTGGKDDVKESTPRTGTSLKDRFSKLKPNAVPTDGGQQRTLDDIHAPDDVEVKVIHTSAARSARFSDRVGIEMDQGGDTFERTISFEEPDDEYEDTASKGVSGHDRVAVGKYASNRIIFEDDAPRVPEKRDDIRSRYISLAHATGGAGSVEDTCVADDAEITEAEAAEEPVKAERTSLAERLKARQVVTAKVADRGPEIPVPAVTYEPDTAMQPLAEEIIDRGTDEAPEEAVGTDRPDSPEDIACSADIPEVMDAVSVEIEDIDADIDTGDGKTVDIPEASAEKVCTECKAIPCAESHSLLPATPFTDEPASCEQPTPVINEALDEIGYDAPSYDDTIDADADDAERGIIMILNGVVIDGTIVPAEDVEYKADVVQDMLAEDGSDIAEGTYDIPEASAEITDVQEETFAEKVCTECKAIPCAESHSLLPAAPVADEPTSCEQPASVSNDELDEIGSDAPSYDDTIDADADDAERGIIMILNGVVIDGTIVPAVDGEYKADAAQDMLAEDGSDIAESADDIPETPAEPEGTEENRICFSFLSERSERSSAEVRFVWG